MKNTKIKENNYTESRKKYGAWLRQERLKRGLTIEDLCKLTGWHFTTVRRIEIGESGDIGRFDVICKALGIENIAILPDDL